MPLDTNYDLIIFGAGPHGIELCKMAKDKGIKTAVIDTDRVCSLARKLPDDLVFASQGASLGLDLEVDTITTKEFTDYYDDYIKKHQLEVHENMSYDYAWWDKHNKHFVITLYDQLIYATNVVIATGAFSKPRRLGVAGEDGESVQHKIYNEETSGKQVLVVGSGNAAALSIIRAAKDNNVIWATRKKMNLEKIFALWRGDLQKLVESGKVTALEECRVLDLSDNQAKLSNGVLMGFDIASINIGYTKNTQALEIFNIPMRDGSVIKDPYTCETKVPGVYVFGSLAEYCQVGGCHKIVTLSDAKILGKQVLDHIIKAS